MPEQPAIRVFNTLTMQKEPLEPLQPGRLGVYVCGPTVYHWIHLGNARTFASFDVVVRYLRYRGYEVKYVRNFTDVDDRILNSAAKQGKTPQEFAEFFVNEFRADAAALKMIPPDVEPRVSDHMPEIVSIIEALIARGVAYESQGDVYFSVGRYPGYARLSRRNLDDLKAGARVEPGEQKHEPLDFALWKAAKPGEASWESPWGRGRPGWHIECSAMSRKHLGESFDIHGGALDLIFPHHENEIAQSEAASGKKLAKYWMHCGFLDLENVKMSKSLGNIVLLRDALQQVDAEALRLFFFSTHYRNQLGFSEKSLADAEARMEYFYETLKKLPAAGSEVSGPWPAEAAKQIADFEAAMDDDFNAPAAMAVLSGLFAELNKPSRDKVRLAWLRKVASTIGGVLGLFEDDVDAWLRRHRDRMVRQHGIDEAKVRELLDGRAAARAAKSYQESDRIRDELKGLGVEVMDTPQGQRWRVLPR